MNFFKIVQSNDHEALQNLIAKNQIDLNQKNSDSCTLLHIAAKYGSFECAKILIKNKKCDIDFQEQTSSHTALNFAIQNKKIDIMNLLIENGANLNLRTSNDYTIAHFAIKFLGKKNENLIKKIIKEQSKENLYIKADGLYSIQDFLKMYGEKKFCFDSLEEILNSSDIKK